MNFRTTRARLATAAVGAAASGALILGVSPASATAAQGFMTGSGTQGNDWGGEGTVSATKYAKTNVSCLWQRILWAEGATEKNGTKFDSGDVDGIFGSNTTFATKNLQKRWKLTRDGMVGPKTFDKADNKLKFDSGSTGPKKTLYLRYDGAAYDFRVRRAPNGQYAFYEDGAWRLATYKGRTCK